MFQSTLLNKTFLLLLQEMLIISGLTHNLTVCFVSWLFHGVILRLVVCCIVSITQNSVSARWVHKRHLITFYSTKFLCSDHCVLDCNTVQFYRFLRNMLPLFSGLKILPFSYVPFTSCSNIFHVVHYNATKPSHTSSQIINFFK